MKKQVFLIISILSFNLIGGVSPIKAKKKAKTTTVVATTKKEKVHSLLPQEIQNAYKKLGLSTDNKNRQKISDFCKHTLSELGLDLQEATEDYESDFNYESDSYEKAEDAYYSTLDACDKILNYLDPDKYKHALAKLT